MTTTEIYSKTTFGFWIYLMTDCILFATLFATYAVLHSSTFGGPSSKELFNLPHVFIETLILLFSSGTSGLCLLAAVKMKRIRALAWLIATFALGTAFITMELIEFNELIQQGNGPQRSAFLSAFFTLVGSHGLHVAMGLVWILVLIFQISFQGLTGLTFRRLATFGLFWHFLDVVWIFIFTFVYLMGV